MAGKDSYKQVIKIYVKICKVNCIYFQGIAIDFF